MKFDYNFASIPSDNEDFHMNMANPLYIESAPGVLCGLCIFAGGRLQLGWKMANGNPRRVLQDITSLFARRGELV